LASTSCSAIAEEILARCLAGEPAPIQRVFELVDNDCSGALFRILIEGLADRFEPRLCDAYADLFSAVIERVIPSLGGVRARYERIRHAPVCRIDPERVYVLSRVTLGADIAVTSVMLDAAKRRFPKAEIFLAGSAKAAELFAEDPRIRHFPVSYPRSGTLHQRLSTWTRFDQPGSLVIDPDSRLSQLGLLPVCDEDRYFFFESRAYGGDAPASLTTANLTTLARRWTKETFEVDAHAYMAPSRVHVHGEIAVSFGVGENLAKRVGGGFETELLRLLSERGSSVIVDRGAGGEEARRVNRAIAASRATNIRTWNGSFAGFASIVSRAKFYAGYDSAGQHAAAAAGTPQLTIFRGHVNERMFQRWRPAGKNVNVLKNLDPHKLLRVLPKLS
jgi:ADP-heptose:LPS heptosyltransferase